MSRETEHIQNILNHAIAKAEYQGAKQIHRINVRLGVASGVTAKDLMSALEMVKKDTIAEYAVFAVEEVPIICYCATCNLEFQPLDSLYQCPECYQPYAEIRQGDEIELVSIDVS